MIVTREVDIASLKECVSDAQSNRVIVTKKGVPIAVMVGLNGLDDDERRYAASHDFWSMITSRRKETPIGRVELERRLKLHVPDAAKPKTKLSKTKRNGTPVSRHRPQSKK